VEFWIVVGTMILLARLMSIVPQELLAAALLASLALGACAAPSSYMGISFIPGAAASDLQDLAQRAQAGDKLAQLNLGIAFEEGRDVAADNVSARKLYLAAANNSGGSKWIYQPSVVHGQPGRVVAINTGAFQEGLVEAKDRLARLTRGLRP
jgi:TPR repeat protein